MKLTPTFAGLITLVTTYPNPQETLLGTPETLPTTEPSTPQIGYTVQSSDLPTVNIPLASRMNVVFVYGAGKFVTAGTLSWRMKKNGVSVLNGTKAVSANTFYTVNAYFSDIAIGDLLELALWSDQTDSNWDYKALAGFLSRPLIYSKLVKNCFRNVTFPAGTKKPILTLGTPSELGPGYYYPLHLNRTIATIMTNPYTFDIIESGSYGIFQVSYGDGLGLNKCEIGTSATYRPYYRNQYVPLSITLRGYKLE